jgi:hypothetical protein
MRYIRSFSYYPGFELRSIDSVLSTYLADFISSSLAHGELEVAYARLGAIIEDTVFHDA